MALQTTKKAILFDNDGVLVDTEHLYKKANERIMEELGFTVSNGQFREYFLIQNTGFWPMLREKGYSEEEITRLREKRDSLI